MKKSLSRSVVEVNALAHASGSNHVDVGEVPCPGHSENRLSDLVFRQIFEEGPANYLLLTPSFQVAAASDSFLLATSSTYGELVGKSVFDVLPAKPSDSSAFGVSQWRNSMDEVLTTRAPNTMPVQRYDVQVPGDEESFEARYWFPSNTPILGKNGEVQWILHRTEDVTEAVNSRTTLQKWEAVAFALQERVAEMEAASVRQKAKATELAKEALVLAKEAIVLAKEKVKDRASNSATSLEMQVRASAMEEELAREEAKAVLLAQGAFELAKEKIQDQALNLAKDLQMQERTTAMRGELASEEAKAIVLAREAVQLAKEKVQDRASSLAKETELQERAEEMEAELARQENKALVLANEKVTDRATTKAREHRLNAEAEQKFLGLLEVAPDAMVIIDWSGTIMLVNAHGEELFGYERGELLGQTVEALLPKGYKPPNAESAAKFFAAPQNQVKGVVFELDGRRKDLTEFPFDLTIRQLQSAEGRSAILTIRDLTERNRLNSQIIRAQRLESIGTFAGNIAHDLNNALAPVLMALELLRKKNPNSLELVNTIEAGANMGAEMLRQLLVFSKGSYIVPKLVQTSTIFDDIRELITRTFPENIEVRISIAERLRPVLGDATQIHQVLLNLCVNARDAMHDGGVLSILAENVEIDSSYASAIADSIPGSYVMWRISDTGTGIPHEILDRIFEPFFTTKSPGKGTGLGLSIVIGIVKSHHGFVNAYSIPKKGSTFSVYFPADLSGVEIAGLPLAIHSSFQGNGEAILVVDDSVGMRGATSSVLDAVNLHVITAPDGLDALALVKKFGEKLSVVITDVHMPNMDGLAFVGELRAIMPSIPIIVISGNLDEVEARKFIALGVHTFLDKPFTQDKLMTALSRVLPR